MVKYHIKPNGEPGKCKAVYKCRYKLDLDHHYSTVKEARIAYEKEMNGELLVKRISKSVYEDMDNKIKTEVGYDFAVDVDTLGVKFEAPDVADCSYYIDPDDNSEYFRLEDMPYVLESFSSKDMVPGYDMNIDWHTTQRYISEEILKDYESERNPFLHAKYKFSDHGEDDSYPLVGIYKDKVFIMDGNHRIIAAREKGMQAFAAVVYEYDENKDDYRQVLPNEFNERFGKGSVNGDGSRKVIDAPAIVQQSGVPGESYSTNRIVLSDVDGTIVRDSLVLKHAIYLENSGIIDLDGLGDKWLNDSKNEELISDLAVKYREEILGKSLDELMVDDYLESITSDGSNFYDTLRRLRDLRGEGSEVVLISGSPSYLVDRFANKYGFKSSASRYHFVENAFNGDVDGMFASASKKAYVESLGLGNYSEVIAFGDTMSDKPLFDVANYSVLVDPTDKTREGLAGKVQEIVI